MKNLFKSLVKESKMSDWYCPVNFPIPCDVAVEVKGYRKSNKIDEFQNEIINLVIESWKPIDSAYEPQKKGD